MVNRRNVYSLPARRPLKIFAFDPMLGRTAGNKITVSVLNEPLTPGPMGERVQVIDYDPVNRRLYQPVNLDDPAVLMNDGLDPTESDPRFHQQMVYTVAMKVLENFEAALGRTLTFRDRKPLRIFPHALEDANAFYDPELVAILFGYFRADSEDPGPNLPGQTIFSCLSHDIVAHEVTHAIVDRLRPNFKEPSNRDVYAFHEGFSDIVAIFQHFSFQEILAGTIQRTRTDLRSPTPMVRLAQQFGYATGMGQALRSALDPDSRPDPKLYQTVLEPHERGSILVAAVFEAFFNVYQGRIKDLVRIATGGTGTLPEGDLYPDLVNRIAKEASKTAQNVLTMCIRAFEYLPPVDITFGDFLRALVTADYDLVRSDDVGLRAAFIEAFRVRGVTLENVASLGEESILWENREADNIKLPFEPFQHAIVLQTLGFERRTTRLTKQGREERDKRRKARDDQAFQLRNFVKQPRIMEWMNLDPALGEPDLAGFHTNFRFSPDNQLLIELVAQFVQEDVTARSDDEYGGARLQGGATVVATADGTIRYVISKPVTDSRRSILREHVASWDREDPLMAWGSQDDRSDRMTRRMRFAALHRTIPR